MSAKTALFNYYKKQMKRERRVKKNKKNNAPEKDLEKSVRAWLDKMLFSYSVVESKAVFSRSANRYLKGQTEAGFSDIVATSDEGYSCFIELKSPGKLSTLRPLQYEFLKDKISKNAFAVCIDSVDLLESLWLEWLKRKEASTDQSKAWLMGKLPMPKVIKECPDLILE